MQLRSKIYLEPRYLEDRQHSLRLKNFVFVSSVAVKVEKDSKQKHNLSEDKNGNQNHTLFIVCNLPLHLRQ